MLKRMSTHTLRPSKSVRHLTIACQRELTPSRYLRRPTMILTLRRSMSLVRLNVEHPCGNLRCMSGHQRHLSAGQLNAHRDHRLKGTPPVHHLNPFPRSGCRPNHRRMRSPQPDHNPGSPGVEALLVCGPMVREAFDLLLMKRSPNESMPRLKLLSKIQDGRSTLIRGGLQTRLCGRGGSKDHLHEVRATAQHPTGITMNRHRIQVREILVVGTGLILWAHPHPTLPRGQLIARHRF